VSVEIPARLTHTLRLVDEREGRGAVGGRRGKPEGVVGAEVWVKLVEANGQRPAADGQRSVANGQRPVANGQMPNGQMAKSGEGDAAAPDAARMLGDPATFSFLTLTTRPTLRTDFTTAAGGKTAVYMLRWVNTRGEKGPWSEIATATVAA
jgi:hypothetical protein